MHQQHSITGDTTGDTGMRSMHLFILFVALLLAGPIGGTLHAQFPFDECSDTEAWIPVHDGFPGRAMASAEMEGKLYVVYMQPDATPGDSSCVLARLDGNAWTAISTFRLSAGGSVSDLEAFGGELYLTGGFDSLDQIGSAGGFAKWDGSQWRQVTGVTAMNDRSKIPLYARERTLKMTVYKGELLVSGSFEDAGGDELLGILAWNGSAWRTIAEGTEDSLWVTSFVEWRGDLYVGGYFTGLDQAPSAKRIAKWDGATWTGIVPYDRWAVGNLVVYNDRLYAIRINNFDFDTPSQGVFARWDGSAWERLPGVIAEDGAHSFVAAAYHGSLYILGRRLDRRQWPTVDTQIVALRWDGTRAYDFAHPNGVASFMTLHNGALYLGGRFTRSCGTQLNGIASLCDTANCVGISGRVVIDPRGDCTDDGTKRGISENVIEVLPGPHYAITDSNGNYRFIGETGSYTVRSGSPLYHMPTCPTPGWYTATLTKNGDRSMDNNFGYMAIPDKHDIEISLAGERMRPGRSFRYRLTCINRGTVDEPWTDISLMFDERLRFDSSSTGLAWNGAGEVGWKLYSMKAGERRTIDIWFTPSTTLRMGTWICAQASAGEEIDETPAGNSDECCIEITTAYDPNDIAVHPAGVGEAGIINEHDSVLTYTVRFQNTGRDTAFRVVVIDTLSRHLDMTSLKLGAASHPYRLRFGEHATLIWDFQDINLPWEKVDSVGSQGYFKYSVRVKRGLSASTQIENRASIYFDYNDPIVTNTARSTIVPISSVPRVDALSDERLLVYPNPTRGALHIAGHLIPGTIIRIENIFGEVVHTSVAGAGDITLDLSALPAGTYFVSRSSARTRIVKN